MDGYRRLPPGCYSENGNVREVRQSSLRQDCEASRLQNYQGWSCFLRHQREGQKLHLIAMMYLVVRSLRFHIDPWISSVFLT